MSYGAEKNISCLKMLTLKWPAINVMKERRNFPLKAVPKKILNNIDHRRTEQAHKRTWLSNNRLEVRWALLKWHYFFKVAREWKWILPKLLICIVNHSQRQGPPNQPLQRAHLISKYVCSGSCNIVKLTGAPNLNFRHTSVLRPGPQLHHFEFQSEADFKLNANDDRSH